MTGLDLTRSADTIREKTSLKQDYATWVALTICTCFAILGLALVPYPGVQNDETLFATGIYQPIGSEHGIVLFHHRIAMQLNSYLGALKTWLYLPIFSIWPPSVYSLRLPVVVIGGLTIWLFFVLARSLLGPKAAVAAAALLGSDATYLLTTTFDWGPVALQHLLAVGGILAAVRFHFTGRVLWLTLAFWCFGSAMWDKALFGWSLIGLVVATMLTAARPTLQHVTKRNIAIATIAFCLGSAPLIRHNLLAGFSTLRENARFSTNDLASKLGSLRACLEGTALFGYMVPDRPAQPPGEPDTLLERASVAIARTTSGHWDHSAQGFAVIASILLLPFAGRARRVGLFALTFSAVTWLAMSLTKGAGTGAHHAVLIWPFPQLLVAAVFVGVLERIRHGGVLYAVVVGALCSAGAVVITHHIAMLVRGGTTPIWTDAIYPLSEYVPKDEHTTVYALDWGFADSLRMLNGGRLRLVQGWSAFEHESDENVRRQMLERMIADRQAIFIRHVADKAILRDTVAAFDAALLAAGYRSEPLKEIRDGFGRPQFEVFRVVNASRI